METTDVSCEIGTTPCVSHETEAVLTGSCSSPTVGLEAEVDPKAPELRDFCNPSFVKSRSSATDHDAQSLRGEEDTDSAKSIDLGVAEPTSNNLSVPSKIRLSSYDVPATESTSKHSDSQDTEVTSSSVGYSGERSASISVGAAVCTEKPEPTALLSHEKSAVHSPSANGVPPSCISTDKSASVPDVEHPVGGESSNAIYDGSKLLPSADKKSPDQQAVGTSGTESKVKEEQQKTVQNITLSTMAARNRPPSEESHRAELSSPEPNCAICLGKMQNKSFTNSCFHQFCFTCLLEWSKVKAECPLCKQPFKSIVHNVRSMEDYDQYYLRNEEFNPWENADGRRFRYRSTLTSERRREMNLGRLLLTTHSVPARSLPSSSSSNPFVPVRHLYSTSDFRRYIYERNLWVVSNLRSTRVTRFREASPEFYSDNLACTHRLLPWLNRELNALQYGHQVAFLLELIMSLILRFHIQSPEFLEHLRPYFLGNTAHFVHEFYSFARSPYDMGDYDRHASYADLPSPSHSGNVSDDGDDVVVLSQRTPTTSLRPLQRPSRSSRQGQASALRAGNSSILNRARDFLDSLTTLQRRGRQVPAATAASSSTFLGDPAPTSPQPGPSGVGVPAGSRPSASSVSFAHLVVSSSDEDSDYGRMLPGSRKMVPGNVSESVVATLVGSSSSDEDSDYERKLMRFINNKRATALLRAQSDRHATVDVADNEEDDCMIVGYGKHLSRRSPVDVIVLSDSEAEVRIDGGTTATSTSPTAQAGSASSPGTPPPGISSSSSVEEAPTPKPSLKIKLSLAKAKKTKSHHRMSRRRRRPPTSSSPQLQDNNELPNEEHVAARGRRRRPPTSSSPQPQGNNELPNEGHVTDRGRRSSSPALSTAPPSRVRTVKSKVIRIMPIPSASNCGEDLECGPSASPLDICGGASSAPGIKESTSSGRSSSSRSRSRSQQSSHSSSGCQQLLSKKKCPSGSRHRHRYRVAEEFKGDGEVAVAENPTSTLDVPRKKCKKHKHHKSESSNGKHKHSRQSKLLKISDAN